MPKLSNANKRARVIRALRRAGLHDHAGGKHTIMTDAGGNFVTTIPNARVLNVITLRAILKQCGLTAETYLRLYK